jgi:predicted MFS family arabinose efflux permease
MFKMAGSSYTAGMKTHQNETVEQGLESSAPAIAAAGLIALSVAMGIGRFAFTPVLPMMQADFGVSVAAAGWLASANYVGYLIGAVTAIALRASPARIVKASLIATGILTLAMGLIDHYLAWIVLRTLAGVFSAWVLVFVSSWCLSRLASLHRAGLGSVVFAGVGVGIALTGILCVALAAAGASSRETWMALGFLALAATAAIWPILRGGPSKTRSGVHSEIRVGSGSRAGELWMLVLCYGAFGFAYIIPATFLPAMARQIVDDPLVFGWSWPLFGAAAALSTLVVPSLNRIASNRTLWASAHLIMAGGLAVMLAWETIGGVLVAALCVGGTFMVITMVAMQEARRLGHEHAQQLMAALTAAFALGQIVGPVAVSVAVWLDFNQVLPIVIALVLLVISAIALVASERRDFIRSAGSTEPPGTQG